MLAHLANQGPAAGWLDDVSVSSTGRAGRVWAGTDPIGGRGGTTLGVPDRDGRITCFGWASRSATMAGRRGRQ
jgi:hypothetical protein